ncbi:hypothetical protein SBADM41S_01011 [Streptomyces badius]
MRRSRTSPRPAASLPDAGRGRWRAGARSTSSSRSSITGTTRLTPSTSARSRQAPRTAERTAGQSNRSRPPPGLAAARSAAGRATGARGCVRGRSRGGRRWRRGGDRRWAVRGAPACAGSRGGAECRTEGRRRAGRAMTAEGSPAQESGADPAAGAAGGGGGRHEQNGGAAVAQPGQDVLDPGQFGLGTGREAVLPARVVGQFVVAQLRSLNGGWQSTVSAASSGKASALSVLPVRTVGPGAARCVPLAARRGPSAARARRRAVSAASAGSASWAYRSAGPPTARSRAPVPAAGSRTWRTGRSRRCPARVLRRFGEVHHQLGELGRGQRVLAGVGVQLPAEQELEGLTGPDPGGQLGGRAQQRHGREQGPGSVGA